METSSYIEFTKPHTHAHTHSRLEAGTLGRYLTVSRGGCVSSQADLTAHSAVDVSRRVTTNVTSAVRPLSVG